MNTKPNVTLRVTRRFTASAERVFDAWLDPSKARKWLFATATGEIVRCDIDAKVGGAFVITRRDGDEVEHVGEYLVIDRPRRLVFTFSVPKYSDQVTTVTVEIAAVGEGCELTLTHENVLPEYESQTQEGWGTILENLDKALQE